MQQRVVLPVWVFASVLTLGGCRAAPVLPSPLALTVDSTDFHRRGQSPRQISFGVTNRGTGVLYLPQCNGHPMGLIDHWSLGAWRYLDGEFCNGAAPALRAIAPGDSARGVVTIYESGAYRLRVSAAADSAKSVAGPVSTREFNVW